MSITGSVILDGIPSMDNQPDRRKYPRFKTIEGLIVELNDGLNKKTGILENISRGGATFYYLNPEEIQKDFEEPLVLTIFSPSDDICLSRTSCNIILDQNVLIQESSHLTSIWKCNVQFKKLKKEQLHQLDEFIIKFSTLSSKSISANDSNLH